MSSRLVRLTAQHHGGLGTGAMMNRQPRLNLTPLHTATSRGNGDARNVACRARNGCRGWGRTPSRSREGPLAPAARTRRIAGALISGPARRAIR